MGKFLSFSILWCVGLATAFLQYVHVDRISSHKPMNLRANKADTIRHSFTIGTRGSPLALAQAEETKGILKSKFPNIEITIKEIVTKVRYRY